MQHVATDPTAPARRAVGKFSIDTGPIQGPRRYFIYGEPGAGKSSLAADAPRPVFLCAEDGVDELSPPRINLEPGGATPRHVPRSWDEACAAVDMMIENDTGFQTFVLDGVDALDGLCHEHVLKQNPKWKSIQDPGFGAGEGACIGNWRGFMRRLQELRIRRSMAIILIGHCKVKRQKNPEGPEFDIYMPSVTDHPQGNVSGLLYGWADIMALAKFDTLTNTENKRTVGVAGDKRILCLHKGAAWMAKCRPHGLPPRIEPSFEHPFRDLENAIARGKSPDMLRAEVTRLLAEVDEETRGKATAWIATIGDDVTALSGAIDKLRMKIEDKEKGETK